MERANDAQLGLCPGGILASQEDNRRPVTINNKKYHLVAIYDPLINPTGSFGLTDYDCELLRSIVPFAAETAKHTYRFRRWLIGGLIGGCLLGSLYFFDRNHRLLPFWGKCLLAVSDLLLCLRFAVDRAFDYEPNKEQYNLESRIRREIIDGHSYTKYFQKGNRLDVRLKGPLTIHSQCYSHNQTPGDQLKHKEQMQHARMAFGNLYVPPAARKQAENYSDYVKPLETILMQADSPLNETLNIPQAHRGKRVFVQSMMNFIKECEKNTDN